MERDLHGTRSSTCGHGRVSLELFFADRQVVTEIGMIVIHSACQIQISRAGVDQAGQSLEGATGAFIGNETKVPRTRFTTRISSAVDNEKYEREVLNILRVGGTLECIGSSHTEMSLLTESREVVV